MKTIDKYVIKTRYISLRIAKKQMPKLKSYRNEKIIKRDEFYKSCRIR